jgi:hypothetical protein
MLGNEIAATAEPKGHRTLASFKRQPRLASEDRSPNGVASAQAWTAPFLLTGR